MKEGKGSLGCLAGKQGSQPELRAPCTSPLSVSARGPTRETPQSLCPSLSGFFCLSANAFRFLMNFLG